MAPDLLVMPTTPRSSSARLKHRLLGFVGAALVMIAAAAVAWWLGIDTERTSLEDVATSLTAEAPDASFPDPVLPDQSCGKINVVVRQNLAD